MEFGINVLHQPKTPALSIMDLGKQLRECAGQGQTNKVHDLMCRGAPFTTDWVCISEFRQRKKTYFPPLFILIFQTNNEIFY